MQTPFEVALEIDLLELQLRQDPALRDEALARVAELAEEVVR